jgi:C4-type Zn-finger protein
MRVQDTVSVLEPRNACPVCSAETTLAEIEPHPHYANFEIHGYLCDRCGPIKSLVVARSSRRPRRMQANLTH